MAQTLQPHSVLKLLDPVAWDLVRAHLALTVQPLTLKQDLKPLDLVKVHPIHVLAQHASRLSVQEDQEALLMDILLLGVALSQSA